MRILHIEDYFFPTAGYQINLLSKYMSMKGHEVHILASKPTKKIMNQKRFFLMTILLKIKNLRE